MSWGSYLFPALVPGRLVCLGVDGMVAKSHRWVGGIVGGWAGGMETDLFPALVPGGVVCLVVYGGKVQVAVGVAHEPSSSFDDLFCYRKEGGWVGWVEEKEAVGMSYCRWGVGVGGWVGSLTS